MNIPRTDPERKCRVTKDYQAEFPNPMAVEAGEAFAVSERNSAWDHNPAWIWVWCTNQRGKSGWAPKKSSKWAQTARPEPLPLPTTQQS